MISKTPSEQDRRVLIFGATGRLGRLLVQYFSRSGWTVLAFVRSRSNAEDLLCHGNRVEIFEGDLTAPNTVFNACQGCSLTVFAAGARRPAYATDSQAIADFQRINVDALREVGLAVLRAGNAPLIHLGSLFALGINQTGTLTEETPPNPLSPFEQSEWRGEQELLKLHTQHGLDCRLLRLPPVTDATTRGGLLDAVRVAACDTAWSQHFRHSFDARKPLISPSDFLSAVDHTQRFGKAGGLYHVSSGDFTLQAIADVMRRLSFGDHTVRDFMLAYAHRSQELNEFLSKYLAWNVQVSTRRAREELFWTTRNEPLTFATDQFHAETSSVHIRADVR